ncbi:MAG: YgaP-like transmembrane domain [Solirubrobacteraceae bacterium]
MVFVNFMQSAFGRAARAIVGIALVVLGIAIGGAGGIIILIVGLVPLAAGLFGFCLIAPLIGATLKGATRRRS